MATKAKIRELVGKDLKGFKIVEMTEVYYVDDDGLKSSSLGYFKNPNTATAFTCVHTDANWLKTKQTLVLTDGTVGYVIEDQKRVKLFDDKTEALKIKKNMVAKLSPAERKLLGL